MEKKKLYRREYCWAVTFEFFYVKQTCNPDYKPGEQPIIYTKETILMTTDENIFLLQDQIKSLIAEWTSSDILGSQRVRVLGIRYVGINEKYIERGK